MTSSCKPPRTKKDGVLRGPSRSCSAGCYRAWSHLFSCFLSLSHSPPHSLSLCHLSPCFAPCATGSFPFLTGFSRFWRRPRRMRVPTAASHPTLPGRTSVMKPGSLSPQVRSVAVLYSVWIGSRAPLGAARPISKTLMWVLGLDAWNALGLFSANRMALSHCASCVVLCVVYRCVTVILKDSLQICFFKT